MTLRCKPFQLCTVDIPLGEMPEHLRSQVQGREVLVTTRVEDGADFWHIVPTLDLVSQVSIQDQQGIDVPAGPMRFSTVWDLWLRPNDHEKTYQVTPTGRLIDENEVSHDLMMKALSQAQRLRKIDSDLP